MNDEIENNELCISKRKIKINIEESDDNSIYYLADYLLNEIKNAHQVELESVY